MWIDDLVCGLCWHVDECKEGPDLCCDRGLCSSSCCICEWEFWDAFEWDWWYKQRDLCLSAEVGNQCDAEGSLTGMSESSLTIDYSHWPLPTSGFKLPERETSNYLCIWTALKSSQMCCLFFWCCSGVSRSKVLASKFWRKSKIEVGYSNETEPTAQKPQYQLISLTRKTASRTTQTLNWWSIVNRIVIA